MDKILFFLSCLFFLLAVISIITHVIMGHFTSLGGYIISAIILYLLGAMVVISYKTDKNDRL